MEESYIANQNTVALVPKYDEYGYLVTKVFEGPYSFTVHRKLRDIMEETMIYYGGEFRGAMGAARKVLKGIQMPPIKVSGQLGIYCFPSNSPRRNDCIWFFFNHILDYDLISKKQLEVKLRYDHHITIPSTVGSFEKKLYRTQKFKSIMEEGIQEQLQQYLYIPQDSRPSVVREHPPYIYNSHKYKQLSK